jgi:hypothetical protein
MEMVAGHGHHLVSMHNRDTARKGWTPRKGANGDAAMSVANEQQSSLRCILMRQVPTRGALGGDNSGWNVAWVIMFIALPFTGCLGGSNRGKQYLDRLILEPRSKCRRTQEDFPQVVRHDSALLCRTGTSHRSHRRLLPKDRRNPSYSTCGL